MSIRNLAIKLLNNDNGIDAESYDILLGMMIDSDDCGDIIPCVEATDGQFYLPSDWKANGKQRFRVVLEIETDNGNPDKWAWPELIDEDSVVLVNCQSLN